MAGPQRRGIERAGFVGNPEGLSRRDFQTAFASGFLWLTAGPIHGAELRADAVPAPRTTAPKQAAAHLLNRLGFGPAPGEIDRVAALGPQTYIDEQLAGRLPMPAALALRLRSLPEINLTTGQILDHFTRDLSMIDDARDLTEFKTEKQRYATDLVQARLSRAVESPAQLREVLTNFWFNHFNIGHGKPWVALLFGNYEEQAIRPYVLSRFRTMLGATAHHPAMLLYLDNDKSHFDPGATQATSPDVAPPGINENYARELMELHTLGVNGGYTQADVIALARILSGWRVHRRSGGDSGALGDFMFDERAHDPGEKMFLGHRIANAGHAEGEQALDILARHPSTAKHIAFQLAQYFIADDPGAAVVERLAHRFGETDGDLRAVLKTLFASPEFWNPATIGRKFKTPYEYVVSALRATGQQGIDYRPANRALSQMGMPLYGCVTPDGYKNTQSAWLSAEAVAARLSYATALTRSMGDVAGLENTLQGVVTEDALQAAAAEVPPKAAAILLGSPEFMRR